MKIQLIRGTCWADVLLVREGVKGETKGCDLKLTWAVDNDVSWDQYMAMHSEGGRT